MESKLTTLVVISTDCTDSCKSDYHMIMMAFIYMDLRYMYETHIYINMNAMLNENQHQLIKELRNQLMK